MDEVLYQTYEFCGLSMDLIFDPQLVPKFSKYLCWNKPVVLNWYHFLVTKGSPIPFGSCFDLFVYGCLWIFMVSTTDCPQRWLRLPFGEAAFMNLGFENTQLLVFHKFWGSRAPSQTSKRKGNAIRRVSSHSLRGKPFDLSLNFHSSKTKG